MLNNLMNRYNLALVLLLAVVSVIAGCNVDIEDASSKADERVYNILDAQWENTTFPNKPDVSLYDYQKVAELTNSIIAKVQESGYMTLDQSVQLGFLMAPEYVNTIDELYLTGLVQADAEHLFEITPFANAQAGYTRDGSRESQDASATAGLSKLLATGALITTDITIGYLDVLSGEVVDGSSSIFSAAITQPLLRGSSRTVVLDTLTQAQHDTLYAIRGFNRYRKEFCVSIVSDYCALAGQSWRVSNATESVEILEKIYSYHEELTKAGRLPKFELDQVKQDLIDARNELIMETKDFQEALDLFKLRLRLPAQMAFDIQMHTPLLMSASSQIDYNIKEQSAIEYALQQRLDLINATDKIEDAKRKIEVAADAFQLGLSLEGSFNGGRRGESFSNLSNSDERYGLMLSADVPFDKVPLQHELKRAIVRSQQRERDKQELTDEIVSEVRKSWRDMAEAKSRYLSQSEARDLARKRLENTSLLINYGRASSRDVLDAQEDLFDAENAYADALTDYSIAEMKFLRDTEILWIQPDGQYVSDLKGISNSADVKSAQ